METQNLTYIRSYLRFKSFAWKRIFKTTNVTKPTKAILESSYVVLKGTSKQKALKQIAYFLNAIEF